MARAGDEADPVKRAGGAPDPAAFARVRAAEAARVRLVERLAPTVVCIFPKGNRNGGGSGVLIHPDGYGLTNYHVVASLGAGREGEGGMSDGKLYPLEVLGIDPAGDVAMFKLTRSGFRTRDSRTSATASAASQADDASKGPSDRGVEGPSGSDSRPLDPSDPRPLAADAPFAYAPLGDSAVLLPGDFTLAMGNPFLLAEDYQPTVTFGIVSGNHRYLAGSGRALIYTDCIEIDTSINPGNSGGPLFNMQGELVGINGRIGIEERGRVNVGVGYSIGVNQIKRFMPALRAGLVTKHATLGATVYDKAYREVCVDQILDTSGAYKAGLRLRDRVLALNGAEIHGANALMNRVGSYPENWPIALTIRREGGSAGVPPVERTLHFRLEALPLPKTPRPPRDMKGSPMRGALTGANEAANIREVRRTLRQARDAICGTGNAVGTDTTGGTDPMGGTGVSPVDRGANVADALEGWTMQLTRTPARGGAASKLESVESRACVDALDKDAASMAPQALETAARWSLLFPPAEARRSQWKILGGDGIGDRTAIVLERTCDDGRRFTLSLDDATGELQRVAFDDAKSGKAVRYDYADYHREGPLRLPHRRTLYLDDERFAEDVVGKYELRSRAGTSPVENGK